MLMMILLRPIKILIRLNQDRTPAGSPIAPMNARGPRSAWRRNAIPILGQFRPRMPSPRDETAPRQRPQPALRHLMATARSESPPAVRAAAIARPARAQAARTPPRRARTADRPRSPPPSAPAPPA